MEDAGARYIAGPSDGDRRPVLEPAPERRSVAWKPDLDPEDERRVEALALEIGQRAEHLKTFRLALGLSQMQMAEILGVTQSNVSKMEAGRDVKLAVLRQLVEAKGGTLTLHAAFDDRELVLPL